MANAKKQEWGDIEMAGVPVKTCELLAADPGFHVLLGSTSSGAGGVTLSAKECDNHPNERLLLHRIK